MADKQTKVSKLDITGRTPEYVRHWVEDEIQIMRQDGWHYADSIPVPIEHNPATNTAGLFILLVFCK